MGEWRVEARQRRGLEESGHLGMPRRVGLFFTGRITCADSRSGTARRSTMRNFAFLIVLGVAIPLVSSGDEPAFVLRDHASCDAWRGSIDNRTNLINEKLSHAPRGCTKNLGGTPGEAEKECCESEQNDCGSKASKGFCRSVRDLRDERIQDCMKEIQENSDALAVELGDYEDRCGDCEGECGNCSTGMTAAYMKHPSCPSEEECWVCQ